MEFSLGDQGPQLPLRGCSVGRVLSIGRHTEYAHEYIDEGADATGANGEEVSVTELPLAKFSRGGLSIPPEFKLAARGEVLVTRPSAVATRPPVHAGPGILTAYQRIVVYNFCKTKP